MTEQYAIMSDETFPRIVDEHGQEVSHNTARWLLKRLEIRYPDMASIYIGADPHERGVYKVGVSTDTERRANELDIWIAHEMPGVRRVVYRTERRFHNFLKSRGLHVRGEWFRLALPGLDLLSEIKALERESDLRYWIVEMYSRTYMYEVKP